ncbi:hypothetical protein TREES_T100017934 [Tupaia chinensis]|uniref:Uncharacterized protein n=1 Tax=Tupaia chinensis TaxID=246437 RepID=L9JQF1_TUPCH|nr:hypothetical protein TREES_T100017934 [Tupaia chinensis]
MVVLKLPLLAGPLEKPIEITGNPVYAPSYTVYARLAEDQGQEDASNVALKRQQCEAEPGGCNQSQLSRLNPFSTSDSLQVQRSTCEIQWGGFGTGSAGHKGQAGSGRKPKQTGTGKTVSEKKLLVLSPEALTLVEDVASICYDLSTGLGTEGAW